MALLRPDVRPGQVPGALQGLLVGLPLFLTGEPEAPLILLNVLSFAGLVLFGHYLTRRFALLRAWMTYVWLLTLPWTLNFSTHVYNPSYLLFLGCLFFVSFFELMPSLTANLVPPGQLLPPGLLPGGLVSDPSLVAALAALPPGGHPDPGT